MFRFLLLLFLVEICGAATSTQSQSQQRFKYENIVITTVLNKPFMMQEAPSNRVTGNERFSGFLPDLLVELVKQVNFTYVIRPAKDGNYGSRQSTGEWNGMIGEILKGDAQMAVADMTITSVRENVVDFTIPFLSTGISIVMRGSQLPEIDPYLIWAPFASDLWTSLIIAFVGMSVAVFVVARFSGAEWSAVSSDRSSTSGQQRQNQFTVFNALFFTIGSLLHHPTNLAPRSVSTRVLSCTWWLFCLATLSIYIANMSAILVHHMDEVSHGPAIQNVEDLSRQTKIHYGTLYGGSTFSFFKTSSSPTYQRIFATMESTTPSVFVKSYDEGLQRVFHENYAMFMEALAIEYLSERYCNLTKVGGLLDYKGYGIALKAGHELKEPLNLAILRLRESGTIVKLYEKWWKDDGTCNQSSEKEYYRPSIFMASFRGVFTILIIGSVTAAVVALLELIWRAHTTTKQQGGSVCREVSREIRYALCGGFDNSEPKRSEDVILQTQDN